MHTGSVSLTTTHCSKVNCIILAVQSLSCVWLFYNQNSPKPGFSRTWTKNFQVFKLDWEKAEEAEIKLPISAESQKKQEFQRISALLTMPKPLTVDHDRLWKILKEMGIPDHLTCLLRNLYAGQEATELYMEQQTGSKLGKEYIKAVYCHPAYLMYMQSISWEKQGWM